MHSRVPMVTVLALMALMPLFSGAVDIRQLRQLTAKHNVTCVLVFGDSSVDPGNNNRLPTTVKGNFPPYGKDFFDRRPTGRFSNGRLATDFIAEAIGYTKIIPAFLDPNLKPTDLLHGVSFASAASGYDDLTANLSEMNRLGATRVVVVGVPPLGCMPLVRTLAGQNTCVESYNQVAWSLNAKIKEKLAILKKTIGIKDAYVDCYGVIQNAINNPKKFGLVETSKGCCGSGTIEYGDTCRGMTTCADPSKYAFWDAVHPTEKMYRILADEAIASLDGALID